MKNCFKKNCSECTDPHFTECETFMASVLDELDQQNKEEHSPERINYLYEAMGLDKDEIL